MSDSQARPDHAWTLKDNPKMNIGETAPSAFASAPLFSPWEAETRIEALEEFDVVDVGTSLWMKQHESLEQLNLQAHQSAQQQGDEFVLEALITFNKLKVLVHELLEEEMTIFGFPASAWPKASIGGRSAFLYPQASSE